MFSIHIGMKPNFKISYKTKILSFNQHDTTTLAVVHEAMIIGPWIILYSFPFHKSLMIRVLGDSVESLRVDIGLKAKRV